MKPPHLQMDGLLSDEMEKEKEEGEEEEEEEEGMTEEAAYPKLPLPNSPLSTWHI